MQRDLPERWLSGATATITPSARSLALTLRATKSSEQRKSWERRNDHGYCFGCRPLLLLLIDDLARKRMTPPSHAHLVYLDKDVGRIARYGVADEPTFNGKRFVLTHFAEADLPSPIGEIDWLVVEEFRVNPPDDMAVAKPEPTEPEAA